MKILIYTLAMIICVMRMDAASLKLDGDLAWEVTEPRLTFKLDGGIQNLSQAGTTSGTIKLVLWATKTPYPAVGSIIGEYTLGQISGGYQFSDFTVKTGSNVPNVTGDYYFTIAVMEYTTAGWANRLLKNTGTRSLLSGNFSDQLKWAAPTTTVIAPVPALAPGQRLKLTLKASEYLNLFPTDSQTVTTVTINSAKKVSVKSPDGKNTAAFTYKVIDSKLNGTKVKAGSLYLDYSSSSSYATVTLYFQSPSSGTYRNVSKVYPTGNPARTETTWGRFTLQ